MLLVVQFMLGIALLLRKVPVGVERDGGSEQVYRGRKTFDPKEVYGDAPNPTQL